MAPTKSLLRPVCAYTQTDHSFLFSEIDIDSQGYVDIGQTLIRLCGCRRICACNIVTFHQARHIKNSFKTKIVFSFTGEEMLYCTNV